MKLVLEGVLGGRGKRFNKTFPTKIFLIEFSDEHVNGLDCTSKRNY